MTAHMVAGAAAARRRRLAIEMVLQFSPASVMEEGVFGDNGDNGEEDMTPAST